MEFLENKTLGSELKSNYYVNAIFKRQRHSDLEKLQRNTIILDRDILFELNINNIVPFTRNASPSTVDEESYWNHFVSLQFMSQLKDRYGVHTSHNLEEEKKLMTRTPLDDYASFESSIVDRNDVIEGIKGLYKLSPRIIIVLKYVNNEGIWRELLNYFDQNVGMIVMICTDGEMPFEIDEETKKRIGSCMVFNKDEGGNLLLPQQKGKGLFREKKV